MTDTRQARRERGQHAHRGPKRGWRRAEQIVGWVAVAGLGVLAIGLVLLIIGDAIGGGALRDAALVMVLGGLLLSGLGWVTWGSWSATLDQAERRPAGVNATTRLTLVIVGLLCLGVFVAVAGGLPFAIDEWRRMPESLAVTLGVVVAVGALLVVASVVAAAIAGGVTLAGRAWWWVGVVFCAGLGLLAYQLATGEPWASGALLLAAGCGGYTVALSVGLSKRREGAIEAERVRDAMRDGE